jgi:hypothetical protein
MDHKFLSQVLESQLESLGAQGLDKVIEKLNTLVVTEPEGWKNGIYTLVADAVTAFGPLGVNTALNAVHDLLDGKPSNMDWADLEIASNLLAVMQNQEASEREASKVFLVQVGGVITDIVTGIVMSIV